MCIFIHIIVRVSCLHILITYCSPVMVVVALLVVMVMIMSICILESPCVGYNIPGSNIPKKQLRVPNATRPPSASRPCHARPTHQPSVSPAKELPPTPEATGGLGEAPSQGQIAPSPVMGQIRANGGVDSIFGEVFPTRGRPYATFKPTFLHQFRYKNVHTNFK